MVRIKKSFSLVLAVMLIASLAAGCASAQPGTASSQSSQTPAPSSSVAASSTAAPSSEAEKPREAVTLRVQVFDRGIQGNAPVDNNLFTKWVNEEFGMPRNITVEYVPCPRAEEENKLNMWMASGDAPDIVFTYSATLFQKYAGAGGLKPLEEPLAQNGKELTEFIGKDILEHGTTKGVQYAIPAKRAVKNGMGITVIRKDWLDKVGMPVPKNTEELYQTLKAFKEKDPGGFGAETIPWAISLLPEMYRGYWNMGYSFYEWDKIDEKMWNTAPDVALPGYKESLRFLNKLYNEKLVSLDFALDKDGKKVEADFSAGKAGLVVTNTGAEIFAKDKMGFVAKQTVPTAEFAMCDPFTGNSSAPVPVMRVSSSPFGMFIMIPESSKNASVAIEYLNWMTEPSVFMTFQFGTEGVNYEMVNGAPKTIVNDSLEKYFRMDYALVSNGTDFSNIKLYPDAVLANYDDAFKPVVKDCLENAFERFKVWPYLPAVNEQQAKFGAALTSMKEDLVVKSIMSKPEEFDATFDKLQKDYMSGGGQAVWDEASKLYDELYGTK